MLLEAEASNRVNNSEVAFANIEQIAVTEESQLADDSEVVDLNRDGLDQGTTVIDEESSIMGETADRGISRREIALETEEEAQLRKTDLFSKALMSLTPQSLSLSIKSNLRKANTQPSGSKAFTGLERDFNAPQEPL